MTDDLADKERRHAWLHSQERWHLRRPQTKWHISQARWYRRAASRVFTYDDIISRAFRRFGPRIVENICADNILLGRIING